MKQLNNLISSWKISFKFFKLSDLKLSILITLNTFIRSTKTLLKNFKYVLIFFLTIYLLNHVNDTFKIFHSALLKFILLFFSIIVFFFTILLTIRPSTDIKNSNYYVGNLKKFPGFLATIALIAFIFTPGILRKYFTSINLSFLNIIIFAIVLVLTPMIVVAPFFFLDSDGKIKDIFKAISNSLKMTIFYYPTFLTLGLVGALGYKLCAIIQPKTISITSSFYYSIIFNLIFKSFEFVTFTTISILFLSLISTFYLKIKHNNTKYFL